MPTQQAKPAMAEVQLIATLRPAPGKEVELGLRLCDTTRLVEQEEPSCLAFLLTEHHQADGTLEFKVIERHVSMSVA
ncbi:hypothetical protein AbraIFM66950_007112 [Aspergillus brasiliensis]|nr:hypothetical protein AbraIFM66950_007112 [Aspergillus brasiliensis]